MKKYIIALVFLISCQSQKAENNVEASETTTQVEKRTPVTATGGVAKIEIITPAKIDSPEKVELGKILFHDKRLSHDNSISCASCHDLKKGGTDLAPVSTGINGIKGPINSPTVFNSVYSIAQFWDGRAKDLEDQASGPVHNPKEMGSNWEEVIKKLSQDVPVTEGFNNQPSLVERFKKIYPDGMTGKNIANAIAAFEATLVTPHSRFDKFLGGDKTALSELELKGYQIFNDYGCVDCHNGPAVGGKSFQKFGLVKDYLSLRGNLTEADNGRFNVTKDPADKHKFKVPSLRTAALTPPYFHDASAPTLEKAVEIMGRHQLGVELTKDEIQALVAFIKSLTGEFEGKSLLAN